MNNFVTRHRSIVFLIKRLLLLVPMSITPVVVWRRRLGLNREVAKSLRYTVQRGPFEGLVMSKRTFWGDTDIATQLLGIYEREVLEEVMRSADRRILLNIGAADGYYSVGWSLGVDEGGHKRSAVAFEATAAGRSAIHQLAIENRVVDRIEVRGVATSEVMLDYFAKSSPPIEEVLIICDIEGGEYELLNEKVLAMTQGAKWIIEAHEFTSEMVAARVDLLQRAAKFFTVNVLTSGSRNPHELTEFSSFGDVDRWLLCAEGRDGRTGNWIVLS